MGRLVVPRRRNFRGIAVLLEVDGVRRLEVVHIFIGDVPVGPARRHDRLDRLSDFRASVNDIHFRVLNLAGYSFLQVFHQVVLHVSGSRVHALLVDVGDHARLQREHVFRVSGDDIRRRVVRVVPRNRT